MVETVGGGPEVGTQASAQDRVLPGRAAAMRVVGASHHGERSAVTVQKIFGEGGSADDDDRAFWGVELFFRKQIGTGVPGVDVLIDVGQAQV